MNHKSCIYCIENILNHKKYIGQTRDFQNRKLSHLSALRNGRSHNRHLQSAFDRYGEQSFIFYIIEECDINNLDTREQFWISKLQSYNRGYNLDFGGNGIRGYHYTEQQKRKISIALKGRNVSDEARKHMSENHADVSGEKNPSYGIPWNKRLSLSTQESVRHKASLRFSGSGNPNYGKKMSDEQKKKLSESHKRHFLQYENPLKGRTRPNISGELHYKAHSVVCLNTGEHFKTIKDAAKKCAISASSISLCCTNKIKSAGKDADGRPLVWMYLEDYSELADFDIIDIADRILLDKKKKLSKSVKCITTGETFESMQAACETYKIDASSLSAHCKRKRLLNGCGRHPTTNELLKWEYIT